MARTMFVNPGIFSNPRRKKAKKRGKGRRKGRSLGRFGMHGRVTMTSRNPRGRRRRRNAGISPFIQNPLILSNPRRRRQRHKNPLSIPSMKSVMDTTMSAGGGAALALVVNTIGTSKIANPWYRRAAQFAAAVLGGQLVSGQASSAMGSAFTGAMMYPLVQDVAADLLAFGVGAGVGAASKEADLDALAADLEDVLDDMDDDGDVSELSDDGDEGDEMYDW